MPVAEGFVIDEQDVAGRREDGDTAEVRTTIDAAHGYERLEQRVIRFAPGRSLERINDGRQEVLYVVAGRGALLLGGDEHVLEAETGAFVAPGEAYSVENPGPEELLVVSVTAPAGEAGVGENRKVTVRYADQPTGTADRINVLNHDANNFSESERHNGKIIAFQTQTRNSDNQTRNRRNNCADKYGN